MPREADGPLPDDRERLRHMLIAARDGVNFIEGRTRDDLDDDRMLMRALAHAVQEIGEAAARVSDAGRAAAPNLPWGSIVQMRHILVHAYFRMSLDALWDVAERHLPVLIDTIEKALIEWPESR